MTWAEYVEHRETYERLHMEGMLTTDQFIDRMVNILYAYQHAQFNKPRNIS